MARAAALRGDLSTYSNSYSFDSDADSSIRRSEIEPQLYIAELEQSLSADNKLNAYSFLSTDIAIAWSTLQSLRRNSNVLIYEYIDEIDPKISPMSTELKLRHDYLIDETSVDIVVCSAKALYDEMAERFPSDRLLLVPNGVDTKHFFSRDTQLEHKLDVRTKLGISSSTKIMGYFGALAQWIDWDGIRRVAQRCPDIEFVFIGVVYDLKSSKSLPQAENIHYLEPIDYSVLPYAVRSIDAFWIPFAPGPIATTTSPLKLFEYFALGKPVVVPSYMNECVQYDEVLQCQEISTSATVLYEALENSKEVELQNSLQKLAVENSWEVRYNSLRSKVADLFPELIN